MKKGFVTYFKLGKESRSTYAFNINIEKCFKINNNYRNARKCTPINVIYTHNYYSWPYGSIFFLSELWIMLRYYRHLSELLEFDVDVGWDANSSRACQSYNRYSDPPYYMHTSIVPTVAPCSLRCEPLLPVGAIWHLYFVDVKQMVLF